MKYMHSLVLLGLALLAVSAEIIRDPAHHVARGDVLATAKRWDEAQAAYRLALELKPHDADAWAGLASVHEQLHRTAEANIALAEALRSDSDCPGALLLRSERHLRQGQTAQAFADIDQVIKSRPGFVRALLVRGRMHLRQNQHEDAIQDFTRYLVLNPTDIEAFRLRSQAHRQHGRIKDAIADLTEILRLDPKDVTALLERAKHQEDSQNFDSAIDDYTAAIKLRPEDVSLCLARARLLAHPRVERYRESLADLERFLAKHTDHAEALFQRGECRYMLGQHSEALKDFVRVTERNPRKLDAWLYRGLTLDRLDRYQDAVESYSHILKLHPAHDRALRCRALAYDALDKPADALADATAAVKLTRNSADAYYTRGVVLYHQGKWAEAEDDYARAMEHSPPMAGLYQVERSNARRRQGKLTEALADLEDAEQQVPHFTSVHTKRASLFISQGKWAQAKAAHEKIVALPATSRNETTQGYSRVLLLMLDHKYEDGLKLAETYVAKNPKDTSWLYDLACALAIGAEVVGKEGTHPEAAALKRRLANRALDLLEQCVALGYRNFVHLRHDWDFESLRSEPRFQKLAQATK